MLEDPATSGKVSLGTCKTVKARFWPWLSDFGLGLSPHVAWRHRGTSLIRNSAPLGSYSRTMSRTLWWPYGGLLFPMSEVTLYHRRLEDLSTYGKVSLRLNV